MFNFSAVAHHQMLSIHPFMDGNGRIGRALGVGLLYTRGFDTQHLFALDEHYAAEAVVVTLKKTRERIMSLKVTAKAPRIRLTKRQEDVLRFLRDRGRAKAPIGVGLLPPREFPNESAQGPIFVK